jgi:hypothetical protein
MTTPTHQMPPAVRNQLRAAYRAMEARGIYPEAATADRFAELFWAEEQTDSFDIGCCDFGDRQALAYAIVALRYLCAVERGGAVELLRLAADDIETRIRQDR